MMSMMKLLPWLMLSWCFAFIMFSNVALVAGDPIKCDRFKKEIVVTAESLILQPDHSRYDQECHENDKLCVMFLCKSKDGNYLYGSDCRMNFQSLCDVNEEDLASTEDEVAGTCAMFGTGIYHVCEGFKCGLQFNECVRSKQAEDPPLKFSDGMTLNKIQLDTTTTPAPEPEQETPTPLPEPEQETPTPHPEPEQETTTSTLEPETPPMPTTTDVPITTSAAQPTTTKVPTTSSTGKKKPTKKPEPAEPTTTTAGAKENFTILKLSAAIIFCAFGLAFV